MDLTADAIMKTNRVVCKRSSCRVNLEFLPETPFLKISEESNVTKINEFFRYRSCVNKI